MTEILGPPTTDRNAARRVTIEDLRGVLAAVATNTLSPVTTFLSGFYVVLAVGHALLVPRPQKYVLVAAALASAAALIAIRAWSRRAAPRPAEIHALEGLIAVILISNSLLHMVLMGDPRQATNLLLTLAGAGFLLVSRLWLIATIFLTYVGWAACMYAIRAPTADWIHYGVGILEAGFLGFVVHVVTFRRLHHIQVTEAAQKHRLEETSEELKKLALVDALTGLNNRRSLMTLGEHRLRLSQRTGQGLTLLFIDLDGMKRINDTWGHQEGDRALIDAALIMSSTFRDSDIVARIGGDEFCALVEAGVEDGAPEKRLQTALDASNAQRHRPYRLSWSVGSASFDPVEPCTMEDLIERADRSMYEQKRKRPA